MKKFRPQNILFPYLLPIFNLLSCCIIFSYVTSLNVSDEKWDVNTFLSVCLSVLNKDPFLTIWCHCSPCFYFSLNWLEYEPFGYKSCHIWKVAARKKWNCFSLSACCSKFLLVLPVIWREKYGACSAVSECEGGWVYACQPLPFAIQSITKGWVGTVGGSTRPSLEEIADAFSGKMACYYCETHSIGLLSKAHIFHLHTSGIKSLCGQTTLRRTIY